MKLFDDKQFYKDLFTIALPIMIQNLINSLVNILDTIMIGRLGTVEIAAVGLGNNFFFLYNMLLFGICSGAAIATVVARFTEAALLVAVSYARRYVFVGPVRDFLAFSWPFVIRFFRITLPVIVNEIIWSLGVSAQNIIFARTHTDAIAAFNITNTISQLTWVFFMGLGSGVAVLIGKKIGEGNEGKAREYAWRIIRFAPLMAICAIFILLPITQLLPFAFNVNEQVLQNATLMIIVLCASYPSKAINMSMIVGICRAGGDTVFSGVFDVVFMWSISLPLAAAVSFFFQAPVWLIYLCICTEEPLKMFVNLWRFRSGKWLHNVTV
jgi:Na+-driven multidrug efflux pump